MWQGQKDLSRLPPRSARSLRATGTHSPHDTQRRRACGRTCCQIIPHTNEKSQVPQKRYLTFLAGAEGLSLAGRLGCCSPVGSAQHRPRREPRPVRSRAPLALAHPSARGFGVDVGERSRERRRARCHPVPAASPRKAGAGLVLRAIFGEGLCIDYHFFLRKKSTSARRMAKLTRITAG